MEKGPLDELTDEEMAMIVPLSEEQILEAVKQGERDLELLEQTYPCLMPRPMYYRS